MNQPLLSACVITFNEELRLERCLSSLRFADEIVVVDAFSTDRTVEIAKKYAHRLIQNAWNGFSEQRNVGLNYCSGRWVFFLDSDEAVSETLARDLVEIARQELAEHPNCYSIKRIEYFLGKELRYGPGNPSFQWRFFKRDRVRFVGGVHEYPSFEGPVGRCEEPIFHDPDLNIERFLKKLNHYTTLEALDRFEQGHHTTLFHAFGTFFTTFIKNGIRYRSFWNGKEGVVLTLLESISRVIRHLKLWVFWQVYRKKLNLNLGFQLPEPNSTKTPQKSDLERPEWRPAR